MARRTKQMIIDEQAERIKELEENLDIQYRNYDSLNDRYFELKDYKNVIRKDSIEYKQLETYKDLYLSLKDRYNNLEDEKDELIQEIQKLKNEHKPKKHNERGAGRKPKATQEQRIQIVTLYATGKYSMDKLCEKFNLAKGTVYNIINEARQKKERGCR